MSVWLPVLVNTPAHAALGPVLTYQSEQPLPAGTLVRVPLGQRETLGVVWDAADRRRHRRVRPGQSARCGRGAGGYCPAVGRTGGNC